MKTFKQAWAEKEREGYQYGQDELEQVRLGWDLAVAAGAEAPHGLTRTEAIDVLDRTIEALAPTTGHKHARLAWTHGSRAVVRSLISAGAFTDGRNWADRLPLQPGEGEP